MISGNGGASNRLVVGRGTDAGSKGSMPHSRFWRGVSRRVRLFAGLGLAVALLATLVALLAPPLQAQTTTVTLVANLSGGSATANSSNFHAQSFTTGSDPSGYSISTVQIDLGTAAGRNVGVLLKEDNGSDEPGDLLETLTNPSPLVTNSVNTFTLPNDRTLARNTTYWITVNEGVGGGKAQIKTTVRLTEDSAYGWTIGDSRLFKTSPSSSWFESSTPLRIEISGTVRPQSNDTTLSDLVLEDASNGDAIALDPGFAPDHFVYAASVRFTVSRITVTPTKNHPNARIFPLQDGDNNELSDADTSQSGFQVDLVAARRT